MEKRCASQGADSMDRPLNDLRDSLGPNPINTTNYFAIFLLAVFVIWLGFCLWLFALMLAFALPCALIFWTATNLPFADLFLLGSRAAASSGLEGRDFVRPVLRALAVLVLIVLIAFGF